MNNTSSMQINSLTAGQPNQTCRAPENLGKTSPQPTSNPPLLPAACQRGLTLVELLAVIVILGLIITVVLKNVTGQSEAAKARLNETKMMQLQQMIDQFRLEYNTYPGSLQDLVREPASVREAGKVFVALVRPEQLKDIYNYDFIYKSESDGRSYSLTSLGSDGIPGGEGPKQDITKRPG